MTCLSLTLLTKCFAIVIRKKNQYWTHTVSCWQHALYLNRVASAWTSGRCSHTGTRRTKLPSPRPMPIPPQRKRPSNEAPAPAPDTRSSLARVPSRSLSHPMRRACTHPAPYPGRSATASHPHYSHVRGLHLRHIRGAAAARPPRAWASSTPIYFCDTQIK